MIYLKKRNKIAIRMKGKNYKLFNEEIFKVEYNKDAFVK
jgi:hypothetical protein